MAVLDRGLDFQAFFAHPAVQTEMRKSLSLPSTVILRSEYGSDDQKFRKEVYQPFLREAAAQELKAIDSPARTFADGEINSLRGHDAARAVIAPPLALLFSLLGAIGHISKLFYLFTKGVIRVTPRLQSIGQFAWVVPMSVLLALWGGLSLADNSVTTSRVYAFMEKQAQNAGGGQAISPILNNVMHIVAVGQGYGYPVNEYIRTNILQGIKFGWEANGK